MTEPLLYVSYGMAKAGSTLAFRLASAVLEEAGVPQDAPVGEGTARFVEVIRPADLKDLRAAAEARPKRPISIKTHGGLWARVEAGLADGWIVGHAVARDPRDVALSMMDASRRNDAWGRRDGQPLRHVEDALDIIREHVKKFETWAAAPNILPLAYERLAFDTEAVAGEIAAQLDVDVDARRCAKAAKAAGTQQNVGRPRRHEAEMSEALSARIAGEFGDFIQRWCAPDFVAPKPGLIGRLLG